MVKVLLSLDFGFGTMNVRNLPDLLRREVVACGRLFGMHAGLGALQEIAEGDRAGKGGEDDEDIVTGLGKAFTTFHPGSENLLPMRKSRFRLATVAELPKSWVAQGLSNQGQVHLSKGIDHISPERNITYIVVIFLENERFTPVVVMGTHLMPGVDSGQAPHDVRLEGRNQQKAGLDKFAGQVHDAGMNLLFGLDSNWRRMPKIHTNQVWFANGTIDKIGYVPAATSNFDMTLNSLERLPDPSDHDFFVANLKATANARYKSAHGIEVTDDGKELIVTDTNDNFMICSSPDMTVVEMRDLLKRA